MGRQLLASVSAASTRTQTTQTEMPAMRLELTGAKSWACHQSIGIRIARQSANSIKATDLNLYPFSSSNRCAWLGDHNLLGYVKACIGCWNHCSFEPQTRVPFVEVGLVKVRSGDDIYTPPPLIKNPQSLTGLGLFVWLISKSLRPFHFVMLVYRNEPAPFPTSSGRSIPKYAGFLFKHCVDAEGPVEAGVVRSIGWVDAVAIIRSQDHLQPDDESTYGDL